MAICSTEAEEHSADFRLLDLKKIIYNPYLFRRALMVTTSVSLTRSRTKGVWRLIEKASRADIKMAELEHPYLRKIMSLCSDRVSIYVNPCFYRSQKLRYPLVVDGESRDGRVTLRHAVGILTREDFCAVVNSEKGKCV